MTFENKKIFFASDFHLGVPNHEDSLAREKRIVKWLDTIKQDAEEIYILGDIFDFWFEYNTVIPKGFVRLQGKLAELRDSNIPIYFFTGNHDMWMFDYFEKELNIPIYRKPIKKVFSGKKFLIGHGDGLGPGDAIYKFWKKIFSNKICQWMFHWIHPSIGIKIATIWSRKSRASNADEQFKGNEKESLIIYANEQLKKEHFDYLIFGHRHLPLEIELGKSKYVNLGDWITYNSYAVFDGKKVELKYFK